MFPNLRIVLNKVIWPTVEKLWKSDNQMNER